MKDAASAAPFLQEPELTTDVVFRNCMRHDVETEVLSPAEAPRRFLPGSGFHISVGGVALAVTAAQCRSPALVCVTLLVWKASCPWFHKMKKEMRKEGVCVCVGGGGKNVFANLIFSAKV